MDLISTLRYAAQKKAEEEDKAAAEEKKTEAEGDEQAGDNAEEGDA